jgi:hypothetical protein
MSDKQQLQYLAAITKFLKEQWHCEWYCDMSSEAFRLLLKRESVVGVIVGYSALHKLQTNPLYEPYPENSNIFVVGKLDAIPVLSSVEVPRDRILFVTNEPGYMVEMVTEGEWFL